MDPYTVKIGLGIRRSRDRTNISLLGGVVADRGDWPVVINKFIGPVGLNLEAKHIEGLVRDFGSLAETYAATSYVAWDREATHNPVSMSIPIWK